MIKKAALLLSVIALTAFAYINSNNTSTEDLSASTPTSTELLALNTVDFDGKCGEGKCGDDKKKEAKCGDDKAKDAKKCGEGKCGDDKKKEEKCGKDKKEHKCGEGKCGK